MRDTPGSVLAHKQIAGNQRATVEFLLAQHERRIAVEQHLLVIARDAGRLRVGENAAPAFKDRIAFGQHRPARMDAADRHAPRPDRVHRDNVAGRERPVEFEVGREHGVGVGHRCFP